MKFLKTFLIILLISIAGLIFFSFYIRNFFKENSPFFSNINQQELKLSSKKEYQIENIKFSLPEEWVEVKKEEIKNLFSINEEKKYNPKLLFLAYKIKGGNIVQFFIEKGETRENFSLKEIVDIIKEINKEKGWNLKIILEKEDFKNNTLDFEAISEKEEKFPLFVKEKIFSFEKEDKKIFYIIGFIVLEEEKEKFIDEIKEILNSIQFIY